MLYGIGGLDFFAHPAATAPSKISWKLPMSALLPMHRPTHQPKALPPDLSCSENHSFFTLSYKTCISHIKNLVSSYPQTSYTRGTSPTPPPSQRINIYTSEKHNSSTQIYKTCISRIKPYFFFSKASVLYAVLIVPCIV